MQRIAKKSSYQAGPTRDEEDRGRGRGTSRSRQVVFFSFLFSFFFSGFLWWRVNIADSSSRREKRAGMEGLTPIQQQDEEQDNLVGGSGPTQRSSSGGRATGSVDDSRVHGNTLATVSASSTRSVQFLELNHRRLTETPGDRIEGGTDHVKYSHIAWQKREGFR